jgi:superfamily II DNA/RNA helicase
MATFQKMMSSSPRAIKQALRRRLLVLLAREQMSLEKCLEQEHKPGLAEKILKLQDEMRDLAIQIASIPDSPEQTAEADSYIAKVKQRLARKGHIPEETSWAIDAEEEAEEVIYSEAIIPDETKKVRELIELAPEGPDRKFDTLVRAVEQLRRLSPEEKFLIFTQYRETLEFLKEELGKLYGHKKIASIKGGPLDEKIAAMESFWQSSGAQFLVSTSAGGEGINLQVCHLLFNYDLPWNPMAVEQRIGRIHRYGQTDTAQVYNLVAEDTVEERIYAILEEKLLEIAQTIGKVNPVTGEVLEDFRTEILGILGSSPNYQDLYKKALVDKDYQRTEREIVEAIEKARQASEALRQLTQELDTFNLQRYKNLKGPFTLDDLKIFIEKSILRLGGVFIPQGEAAYIETPKVLQRYPSVSPFYENVTFDRKLALRRRKVELFGLGHPLVDALITHLTNPIFSGDVTVLEGETQDNAVSVRCLFTVNFEGGMRRHFYKSFTIHGDMSCNPDSWREDIACLTSLSNPRQLRQSQNGVKIGEATKQRIASIITEEEARIRAGWDKVLSITSQVVGLTSIRKYK